MDTFVKITSKTAEILHQTETGGFIGGQLLADRPLADYLADDESAKYVLRNKSGVTIETETGEETVESEDGYQTLAVATDKRVLVVAGRSTGDESIDISLSEVLEARAEKSGFREWTLEISLVSDECWRFPCGDDPEPAAEYIELVAQRWATADRLLDDVIKQVRAARTAVAEDNPEEAEEMLVDAEECLETARERVEGLGPAPRSAVLDRAESVESRLLAAGRWVVAHKAASAHATGQEAWEDKRYERALEAYEMAIVAYRDALTRQGSTPADATLRKRLRGVAAERELLRAGPLLDAHTARERAERLSDPVAAAEQWETALDAYRDVLCLDWAQDHRFVADRERVREYAAMAADGAIAQCRAAGEACLSEGDEIVMRARAELATHLYERARAWFERAYDLACELEPADADELADALETAEDRLDTNLTPEESTNVSWEEVASAPTMIGDDVDAAVRNASHGATDGGVETADSDADSDATTPGSSAEATTEPAADSTVDGSESDCADDHERDTADDHDGDASRSTADAGTAVPTDAQQIQNQLTAISASAFTELVADLWESRGWSTMVLPAADDASADVVATRPEPADEKLLLWTVHRPDGDSIGTTVLSRCADAYDRSQGATEAVLLTTGSLTSAAEQYADQLELTVASLETVASIIQSEGLEPSVREAVAENRD